MREFTRDHRRFRRALVLGFLAWGFAFGSDVSAEDPIRVIANDATAVRRLTRGELRAIFSMRMTHFADGIPVTVFVLPDQDERHRAFTKQLLNLLPYVLRDTWDRLVFTGTGKGPVVVQDPDELIRRVADTPGGIGYIVGSHKVTYANIKTLEIN